MSTTTMDPSTLPAPLDKRWYHEDFLAGFLEAVMFSWTDHGSAEGCVIEDTTEDRDISRFTADAVEMARDVCWRFVNKAADDLVAIFPLHDRGDYSAAEAAGHDLALTSQRSGVGFWDRGYGPAGDRLTEIAHEFEYAISFQVTPDGEVAL